MNSLDRILAAFDQFCATGEVADLADEDAGYIHHSLRKAQRTAFLMRGDGPTVIDHQLFMLLSLKGGAGKMKSFLLAVAKKKVSGCHEEKKESS